jgi:serralysin
LLICAAVALCCAAFWPASSHAFVGCTHSGGTLTAYGTGEEDQLTIVRGGDAINVVAEGGGGPDILLGCVGGAATVFNTDLIAVENGEGEYDVSATIDLSGGPFAPGATPEADGFSEIEITARPTGSYGTLGIAGTPGADALDLGRTASGALGANLNPGAEAASPDPDLELTGREMAIVFAGGGRDLIRAQGAPGFAGAWGGALVAVGGPGADVIAGGTRLNYFRGGAGDDRLFGSVGRDLFLPQKGRDRVVLGAGADIVVGKDGEPEKFNCGGGRDLALIDSRDKGRSCKRDDLDDIRLKLSEPVEAAIQATFQSGYD